MSPQEYIRVRFLRGTHREERPAPREEPIREVLRDYRLYNGLPDARFRDMVKGRWVTGREIADTIGRDGSDRQRRILFLQVRLPGDLGYSEP